MSNKKANHECVDVLIDGVFIPEIAIHDWIAVPRSIYEQGTAAVAGYVMANLNLSLSYKRQFLDADYLDGDLQLDSATLEEGSKAEPNK